MGRNTALLTSTIIFIALTCGTAVFFFYYMLEYDHYRLATQAEYEKIDGRKVGEEEIPGLKHIRQQKEDALRGAGTPDGKQSLTAYLDQLKQRTVELDRRHTDSVHRRSDAMSTANATIGRVEPVVKEAFTTYVREFEDIKREDELLANAEALFKREKADLERELGRVERELKRRKSELEDEIGTLKADIQKVRRLLGDVEEKLRILRERRELADVLEEDGRIIEVGKAGTNYVAIDRGYSDGIRKGLKFDVFQEVGSGVKLRKGKVEVMKVHANSADCTVLPPMRRFPTCPQCGWEGYRDDMRHCIFCALGDNNDEVQNLDRRVRAVLVPPGDIFNPIARGDKISNPFYYKGRRMKFVFAGEPVRRPRREIELFIHEHGSTLEDKVELTTDYLIVGAGPRVPEMLEEARRKGVKVMPEEELYEFFGRPSE